MFFKKKKEETVIEPNSKAYSEYVWAFNMLGGNTLAMENLFHKFKNHEKTTEHDVEETKPQMTKLQQQAKLILENSHYKLLAQGDPKSQLQQASEGKEIIAEVHFNVYAFGGLVETLKQTNSKISNKQCEIMASSQILENCSQEDLEEICPAILNKRFNIIDIDIKSLSTVDASVYCFLKVKIPYGDEKHTKELKALDILFSGKSGESHLLAVKEEIELLNNNIKEFIEQTNCFIRMAEDEEAFGEDIEEIYSADEELENVRNSFFGIKPTI